MINRSWADVKLWIERSIGLMEHRYEKRISVYMPVKIIVGNIVLVSAIIRNFSKKGMFIETKYSEIAVLRKVEIDVPSAFDKCKKERLLGLIVHKNNRGYGVELMSNIKKSSLSSISTGLTNTNFIPVLKAKIAATVGHSDESK